MRGEKRRVWKGRRKSKLTFNGTRTTRVRVATIKEKITWQGIGPEEGGGGERGNSSND